MSQAADSSALDIWTSSFSMADSLDISKLVRTKDKNWLRDHGGVEILVLALEKDLENGIRGDGSDIKRRRIAFGSNVTPENNLQKWHLYFLSEAIKYPVTFVTLISAMLSLFLNIQKHGLEKQVWELGVSNFVGILFALIFSQSCNFFLTNLCIKYSKISSDIPKTNVVRSSIWKRIPIVDVVVGDIVFLKPGDQVPADGVFIDGCSLFTETMKTDGHIDRLEVNGHENPFLFYGSTVVDGWGRMLVTAVGQNGKHHMIYFRGSLIDELQRHTSTVEYFSFIAALLVFGMFLWRISPRRIDFQREKYLPFWKIIGIGDVVIASFGVMSTLMMIVALTSSPVGLVLAARMTLAFSVKRLMKNEILVREPSICNSVSSVTTICLNKTGTLTEDSMKVTMFWQGLNSFEEFAHYLIAPNVLELLCQGIGLNAVQSPSRSSISSPTNSTDEAIFDWAVKQLSLDDGEILRNCTILETEPFNSKYRQSGVLISKNDDNTIHVHRKGDAEVILPMCCHYYDTNGIVKEDINKRPFYFSKPTVDSIGSGGTEKFMPEWNTKNNRRLPRYRLKVKLITGDNTVTARATAIKCGILKPDYQPGEVVDGEEFRNFTFEEKAEKVENIVVLTRATPDDKLLIVQCLKKKGHVVAFLGSGIGDAQALREADVGLCFGTQGAEISKACSPIVILNKDFTLIMDILKWGRGIYESLQIYTEFSLLATYVALVTDILVVASSSELPSSDAVESGTIPFLVFELLMVNILAAAYCLLAILFYKPSESDMQMRPPRNLKEPLVTATLRHRIWAQALYLIAIILVIHFQGESLFNTNAKQKEHMILITYVSFLVFMVYWAYLPKTDLPKEVLRKRKHILAVTGLIIYVLFFVGNVLLPGQPITELYQGEMAGFFGAAFSTIPMVFRIARHAWNLMLPILKLKVE